MQQRQPAGFGQCTRLGKRSRVFYTRAEDDLGYDAPVRSHPLFDSWLHWLFFGPAEHEFDVAGEVGADGVVFAAFGAFVG